MRLIDADKLSEELNSFSVRITGSANAIALLIMDETKKSIAKMIDEQPTAYDVDKVKERIYLLQENAENNDLNTYEEKAAYNTAYFKAIEVVESGGRIGEGETG